MSGGDQLKQTIARIQRAWRKGKTAAPATAHLAPALTEEWAQNVTARLEAVEAQLTNQNRLLITTIITIIADAVYRVVTK